jgi:malonate-semialdehyde dehydrogenase (acetylating) / methylmalonate-semialdehyde dehydrogenase
VTVGDGLQPGVDMGPVISARHKACVLGYVERGVSEGAKLVADGQKRKLQRFPGSPRSNNTRGISASPGRY